MYIIQNYSIFPGDFFFLLCLETLFQVGMVTRGSPFVVFGLPSHLGMSFTITSPEAFRSPPQLIFQEWMTRPHHLIYDVFVDSPIP